MGFLDKLTGNTPEVKKAIEAKKAQMKAEGDAVNARIATESQQRRSAMDREHAERMAPLDAQIAGTMQDMESNRRQFALDQVFGGLERGILTSLTLVAAKGNISDPRGAMNAMRKEVEEKVAALKANPSSQTLSDLEAWVLSQVGDDERLSGRIKTDFQNFIQNLEKQGAALE